MTKITAGSLRAKLARMKAQATPLEREVIQEAIDHEESEVESFFKDLAQHGCQSGMVTQLIYYTDTKAFFEKHCIEIIDMWEEMGEEFGEIVKPNSTPAYNWFAWFGFEETARKIAGKLDIEV